MLRLTNATSYFELEVLREEGVSENCYRSLVVRAAASSNGFSGESEAWVFTEHFEGFCKSLASLNEALKGEAVLESMSPNELSLKLASVNSRGYLGVSGMIGHLFLSENSDYWHSVSFGFEFEPAQLQIALQSSCVKKYAG